MSRENQVVLNYSNVVSQNDSQFNRTITKVFKSMIQCMIFAVVGIGISTVAMTIYTSVSQGAYGKFDFLGNERMLISFIEKMLIAISFILLGTRLPVKNPSMRGIVFIFFIWISDYFVQIMGLAGTNGRIAQQMFHISMVATDSIVYILEGIFLGIIIKEERYEPMRRIQSGKMIKISLLGAFIFPCMVLIVDQLFTAIDTRLGARGIMGVPWQEALHFYLIFYSVFIITGAVLPAFYRLTLFNSSKKYAPFRFGLIYGICIWMPVTLIMISFGAKYIPTLIYAGTFIIIHLIYAQIYGDMMKRASY